jgi:hypothetical protein
MLDGEGDPRLSRQFGINTARCFSFLCDDRRNASASEPRLFLDLSRGFCTE